MKFALTLALLVSSASAFNGLNFGGRGIRRAIRRNKSPFKGGNNNFGKGGIFGGNGQPPVNNNGLNSEASGDGQSKDDGLWAAYVAKLESDPLLTKAMTSLIGFGISDILCQQFLEKVEKYDPVRTLRFASFGFLIHGPTGHWFYGKLDKLVPGTGAIPVFSKVGIDQILWNPIFGVMFFGYMGLSQGESISETTSRIKRDLMLQVKGSWSFWIPAHIVNFRFIPTSQRLLYINCLQILYNIFLSLIGNKE